MKSGIYKITNTVNGKIYIGSTTDLVRREYDHFYYLQKDRHYNPRLQNSYNIHGRSAFIFEVVELVERENLIEREQFWIDKTRCYVDGIGFNISKTAKSSPDRYIDPDREKVRVEKIRKAFTGRKKSPEHVLKIKAHRKGNSGRLGVPHDDETKLKIGNANRGSKNAFAKLTEDQVREIKIMLRDGVPTREIKKKFNISAGSGMISDIKLGKTWKHVTIEEEELQC